MQATAGGEGRINGKMRLRVEGVRGRKIRLRMHRSNGDHGERRRKSERERLAELLISGVELEVSANSLCMVRQASSLSWARSYLLFTPCW